MKHTIDFEVYSNGKPKTLNIIDQSEYFELPDNMLIEVQFPSMGEVFSYPGKFSELNILNTKVIGYSPTIIDFPDGLYNIKLSVTPNAEVNLCQNHLKMDKLKCKLAELLQEECMCDDKVDLIFDIHKFIVCASANENTNPKKAVEYFQRASTLIKNIQCVDVER